MNEAVASQVGVVAIGRNEGERLEGCLSSVSDDARCVVYVDSGSTDGSVALARARGAEVVELDRHAPFTAARARNTGIARLVELHPDLPFVQVVDGDCELDANWLPAAATILLERPKVAVVFGRRRERYPDASEYNRLCDIEWNTPLGESDSCGGDAMIRLSAFHEIGAYDPALIAGEEPEMCVRLRQRGWQILRVDHEMTLHDAQMTRFFQWWRRMVRSGHAYAEGRAMHGSAPVRFRVREVRSIIEWGLLLPLFALATAWFTWGASLLLLLAYLFLWRRVRTHRLEAGDVPEHAGLYARSCVIGKFPQMIGVLKFHGNRLLGRRAALIEYKNTPSASPQTEAREGMEGGVSILYVGGTLPTRSETFVYRELLALRDRGITVHVASLHEPQRDLGEERLDALADEAIKIYPPGPWPLLADAFVELLGHPIRGSTVLARGLADALLDRDVTRSRRPKVLWQCLAGLALARRARHLSPAHIHVHMAHVQTTIAMYAARQLGIGFSFTGHAVDIFQQRTLLGAKLRRAVFVACISHWHRAFYRQIEPLPDDRLPIVRCGVDVGEFAPAPRHASTDVRRIVAVGRLIEKKGFDLLIRAVAELRGDGLQVSCVIVGDGPQRNNLQTLIEQVDAKADVSLLGAQDNRAVSQLLRDCDLFVLPCRIDPTGDRDGIPVVLMEAMACGDCAVSGDLPAIRELISDGESGVLVTPEDLAGLVTALRDLATLDERRHALGEAGRRRVVEEFALAKNVDRLVAAFHHVAGLDMPSSGASGPFASTCDGAVDKPGTPAAAEASPDASDSRRYSVR